MKEFTSFLHKKTKEDNLARHKYTDKTYRFGSESLAPFERLLFLFELAINIYKF